MGMPSGLSLHLLWPGGEEINDETSYLKAKTNILLKQVNEFNCSCALELNGTQCEIGTRCECDQVVSLHCGPIFLGLQKTKWQCTVCL